MIAKCVWPSRSMASVITARASAIVFARSTLGRSSSCTACQLSPPSLGSKCRSRTVFQTTSNDSTFFDDQCRTEGASLGGRRSSLDASAPVLGPGSWAAAGQ